jgi:MFS family permease
MRERGRVQGWLSSVWAVAAVAGPTLGGLFADYVSWRWIFLINLPIGAVALTLIIRFLHEGRAPARRHRIDYGGSALILLSCGLLVFALLQGGVAWAWRSPASVACFAGAAVLIAGTVLVERRATEPVVPGWLWRERVLAGSTLGYVALGLLVIGPSAFLPTFAQTVLGLGAVGAGFVLATMSISWPAAAALCSRLYLRIGFRDTALLGAAVSLVGVGCFLFLPFAPPVWTVVGSTLLLGAGLGLISTPLIVGVQSTVPHERRGVATGSLMFGRFLGQSLGAAVFGAIVNSTLQHHLATAPSALSRGLPGSVDAIEPTVERGAASAPVLDYLRHALDAGTHHVYLGLTVVAVLAAVVLLVCPRRFPVIEGAAPVAPVAGDEPGAG